MEEGLKIWSLQCDLGLPPLVQYMSQVGIDTLDDAS
jgi:hypothetical protein